MTKPKLCIDCKWYEKVLSEFCHSPKHARNLVDGEVPIMSCYTTRYSSKLCGKSAKWFEPK